MAVKKIPWQVRDDRVAKQIAQQMWRLGIDHVPVLNATYTLGFLQIFYDNIHIVQISPDDLLECLASIRSDDPDVLLALYEKARAISPHFIHNLRNRYIEKIDDKWVVFKERGGEKILDAKYFTKAHAIAAAYTSIAQTGKGVIAIDNLDGTHRQIIVDSDDVFGVFMKDAPNDEAIALTIAKRFQSFFYLVEEINIENHPDADRSLQLSAAGIFIQKIDPVVLMRCLALVKDIDPDPMLSLHKIITSNLGKGISKIIRDRVIVQQGDAWSLYVDIEDHAVGHYKKKSEAVVKATSDILEQDYEGTITIKAYDRQDWRVISIKKTS